MSRLRDIKNRLKESLNNQASINLGMENLDIISDGSTRVVAQTQTMPGKVIKFPSTEKYTITNRKELATWKAYRNTEKSKYFVPIDVRKSDPQGKYIVMDYADNSSGNMRDLGFESADELCEEFNHQSITPREVDLTPHNIAAHKGDYKLIDYAWLPPR